MKTPSSISNTRVPRASPGGSITTRAPSSPPPTRKIFAQDRSGHKFYNPDYKSCTKLLADMTSAKFGFDAGPLAELIHWGDIIDGAQYPTPESAVELAEPATQLALVIEAAPEENLVPKIIPEMAATFAGRDDQAADRGAASGPAARTSPAFDRTCMRQRTEVRTASYFLTSATWISRATTNSFPICCFRRRAIRSA